MPWLCSKYPEGDLLAGPRDAATSQGEPVVRDRPGKMGDFQWEFPWKTKHFILPNT